MTIRIVTDSTCDLPLEVIQKYKITVVPLNIHIGSQEYRDSVDLSRREFYERLPFYHSAPTTAAPSPEVFLQAYRQLAAEGATEILSIHISKALSAVGESAWLAAEEMTKIPVRTFDSRQLSLGMGFEILMVAQAAADGKSMDTILRLLEAQITRTYVFAMLDTLAFLRRSGRMSFAISTLGTLLRIKPILTMYDGSPTAERVRTRKGAMNRLMEMFRKNSPYEKVAVLHTNAFDRAQALRQDVRDIFPAEEIWVEEINPVIGAHIGPGVIGFACVSK